MYYTIYKIVNLVNHKTYIGKHQTKNLDDGYMGSGKLLKRAIAKYGIESFTKEILFVFDNEAEMNAKEKELVQVSEKTYNLCEGGKGGFGYINRTGLSGTKEGVKARLANPSLWLRKAKEGWTKIDRIATGRKISETHKLKNINHATFKGKNHSDEARSKIRKANGVKTIINGVVYDSKTQARKALGLKSLIALEHYIQDTRKKP